MVISREHSLVTMCYFNVISHVQPLYFSTLLYSELQQSIMVWTVQQWYLLYWSPGSITIIININDIVNQSL